MWELFVVLRIIIGNVLTVIILKTILKEIASLPHTKKTALVFWQFLFCFAFSLITLKFSGKFELDLICWVVAVTGFFNAYGAYCQWRAIDISLSRTSIGTQFDDAIAIMIGYFFLGEAKFFGLQLVLGILLCFTAAIALIGFKINGRGMVNRQLVGFVLKYSLIWGIAGASFKYFNLQNLPLARFLVSWYGGSVLGAFSFFFLANKNKTSLILRKKEIGSILVLASFVWLSLALAYKAAQFTQIAIYQPIFLVSEAVFPTIIGLYLFHERKELVGREWLAIAIGIIGTILVGLSSL